MAKRLLSNCLAAVRLPASGSLPFMSAPARATFATTPLPTPPVASQRSFENLRDWLMSVNAHLGDAVAVPFQKARFHQNILPYVAGKRNNMLVWDGDIIVESVRRTRSVMFAWGRSNVRVLCIAPPQYQSLADEFQSLIMPDWPEVKKLVAEKPLRELFRLRELHAVVFIRPDLTQRLTREALAAQVPPPPSSNPAAHCVSITYTTIISPSQVPTIAFLDGVNVDPSMFTYGIPGNCDSHEFVRGVLHIMAVAHSFGRTLPAVKDDSAPNA